MKNWLLYFFAIFISVGAVGIGSGMIYKEESLPKLTVFRNGGIDELTVEEYAFLVLLSEYESCTDAETRKALAVSARSVGLYLSAFGCKHEEFDACDNGSCCFSLGSEEEMPREAVDDCRRAVEQTYGLALFCEEQPAMALFCACAGSGSGNCKEFPYLTSVTESESCRVHITEKLSDYSELTHLTLSQTMEETAKDNSVLVYDESKKCVFAVLDGRYIDAHKLMKALSLKSPEFTLEFLPRGIKTLARGAGHGYGMSLCGAEKQAKAGWEYEKILENYYPNLILKKLYNN